VLFRVFEFKLSAGCSLTLVVENVIEITLCRADVLQGKEKKYIRRSPFGHPLVVMGRRMTNHYLIHFLRKAMAYYVFTDFFVNA
jgi:hypothetical protein